MAAKHKHTKKTVNFSTILMALLSVALVAVIVFGIFVLINDPDLPGNNEGKKENETTDVKKELKNNTDDNKAEDKPTENGGGSVYDDDKAGYESGNTGNTVERDENGKKIAKISLSIAQNDAVVILSGRVTNFKEEGGNCTYILKRGDETKKYASIVIPDAKDTVCEAVKLEKSSLGSGEWIVTMDYKSNNAEGTSEAQKINL